MNPHNRIEVMAVLAHELGHVLGFQHTAGRCSTMSAMLDVDGCGVVTPASVGYYKCKTIDSALLARFVRLYGGRAKSPTTTQCLIDPMPSALPQVAFDSGTDAPVTIRWAQATTVPSGSLVGHPALVLRLLRGRAGLRGHRLHRPHRDRVAGPDSAPTRTTASACSWSTATASVRRRS